MLFAVNIIFIPRFSYWACAWGGVAGYGTAMVLSYIVGQKMNPIPYPMKDLCLYVVFTGCLFGLMQISKGLSMIGSLAFNTLLIALFVAYIIRRDLPLSSLPVIGKYFRK